jgi:hypothetical protein
MHLFLLVLPQGPRLRNQFTETREYLSDLSEINLHSEKSFFSGHASEKNKLFGRVNKLVGGMVIMKHHSLKPAKHCKDRSK